MKAALPKVFSRGSGRDKTSSDSHKRNKSSEPASKSRTSGAELLYNIFRPEQVKQAQREKEEEQKEAAKIDVVSKRLEELNYHKIERDVIRYALNSKFAAGDADKTVEFLQLQQKAFAGIIEPYNSKVKMLGAENRGNVTCYIDALLFAMFAKLDAFECVLKNDWTDEPQRQLAGLLRLWVNMLRSGKLIHTDMTQLIQEALASCGWKEAKLLEQQDTSEAFGFISETLQLPLLALQVDLYHQGKKDADDHKVVHERLLNLAVPPDPEGKGIKLEDCLEEYFNNKVDVLRDSLEEKKSVDKLNLTPMNTIRLVAEEVEGDGAGSIVETPTEHVETAQLQRRWTTQDILAESPVSIPSPATIGATFDAPSAAPLALRHRSTSIIQRIVVDGTSNSKDPETSSLRQRAKRTGSTVVKAVTIPAWQFFRLIPWHATAHGEPRNDVEVAQHFNRRPIVGICLKRYTMSEQGVPKRQNTLIDIPDSLRLPHFMVVDDAKADQESEGLSQEYKLVLQSVICHRGDSLHSGHYIAFARVAPKLLTDNRRHDHDPPPDYEEAQWAKFDDLETERVTYVDDIKKSLREEMPYLLFYQVMPMVDVTTASTEGSLVVDPPAYDQAGSTVPGTPVVGPTMDADAISRSTSGYFDSTASTLAHNGPSIRFSGEGERPIRLSFEDRPLSIHLQTDGSCRGSVSIPEIPAASPAVSPDAASPSTTPPLEESTAARLTRAAAKFTKTGSKSRPTSQAGEGRMSITMSRFGFRSSRDSGEHGKGSGVMNGSGRYSGEVTVDEVAVASDGENGKDEEKEKEHHGHHHHHNHHKKDKGKDSGKKKEKNKEKGKGSVPDRECIVM